jgi:metal-responsive CopG/Arc/MetJ family transcriptional regulator
MKSRCAYKRPMSPVLTGPVGTGDATPTSVRIPKSLLDEIDEAAQEMSLSRSEAILQMLRWAVDAHHKETRKVKK